MADLNGRVVAFLEGRRANEMADLISRHGGVPLAAPSLREVHAPNAPHLAEGLRQAVAARAGVAIFLTGVGTQTLFDAAAHAGLTSAWRALLESATVVARGPKPIAALRKHGVRIDVTAAAPNTSAEVLAALEPIELRGVTVVVQLYGEPSSALSEALRQRGATLVELAPYAWERPVDPTPIVGLLDALDAGRVAALLVTSQAQVDNLFAVASESGRVPRLDSVAIGPQGPVAEAALLRHGLRPAFRPSSGSMGALVLAAAAHFASASDSAETEVLA